MGLMHLMPATAQQFGATHPFQIHENVRAGVAYLAALMRLFDGDLRLVTAAYATGESPIPSRGLYSSWADVYRYVQLVAQQYEIELRRQERR
jgi:soluble lytic murein transglycosylase-like protein